jgi:hypothetical protein
VSVAASKAAVARQENAAVIPTTADAESHADLPLPTTSLDRDAADRLPPSTTAHTSLCDGIS